MKGAKAGDSLFMHYSGHGGSVKDHTGDEEDNKDETMVPVDYAKSGQIKDDEILKEVCVCVYLRGWGGHVETAAVFYLFSTIHVGGADTTVLIYFLL